MTITFEPLNEAHFPLLIKWLDAPHVKKWWPADRSLGASGDQDVTYTLELVKEKFGKHIHGFALEKNSNYKTYAYIICVHKEMLGYIQAYNAHEFAREDGLNLSAISGSVCVIDLFIGEQQFLHQGWEARILNEFEKQLLATHFDWCLIDPAKDNLVAIKAFTKAGFKKFSEQENTTAVWMLKKIKKVRLSYHDLEALEFCFKKHFLNNDRLWLFGSRADLTKKGGDIDLYIETNETNVDKVIKMESRFIGELEDTIGEQKIDVVLNMISSAYSLPIHEIAKTKGVQII